MPPVLISKLAEYTTITSSAYIPIVDINAPSSLKNKKITINDLRKVFYSAGITLSSSFIKHTPGMYYFGDNRDGNGIFTGSITSVRTSISKSFSSTLDGPPIIKNFSNLFISRSVIACPTNRCRGMLIFVDGDATISGSLTMTARGAKFTGSDASFQTLNPPYLGDYWSTQLFPSASYLSRVFAVGSGGGLGYNPSANGQPGTAGGNGRSGGGGGGGGQTPMLYAGGNGAAGTSFSGGSGGGGGVNAPYPGPGGDPGKAYGGAGGPTNGVSGGGAGNPAGNNGFSNAKGGEGTGGLLILIVRGNLKIGPNGSISANGSSGGGNGSGGGGGGSGGGVLYVYYGGTLTNNGTVTANGGSGGPSNTSGWGGGAGGVGTAIISKLNTAFPIIN